MRGWGQKNNLNAGKKFLLQFDQVFTAGARVRVRRVVGVAASATILAFFHVLVP